MKNVSDDITLFQEDCNLDPRQRRTKQELRTALCALITQKALDQITVTELVDAAGVYRSTFYLHYANVNELFTEIEEEILRCYKSMVMRYAKEVSSIPTSKTQTNNKKKARTSLLTETFTFLQQNAAFSPVILANHTENQLLSNLMNLGQEIFFREWEVHHGEVNEVSAYFYEFISQGIVGVIRTWMQKGMIESPQKMGEITFEILSMHN